MARPSSLTDDVIAQIVPHVERGHYIETVCQAAGIPRRTYYNWLEQAEAELDANPDADTPHTRFWHTLKSAEARAEMALGEAWLEAGDKGWLKYATFSSRRFRKHWHDKEPEQHNTFVQNNYQLMPGQAGYEPPRIIDAELSPLLIKARSEGAQNV